MRYRLDRGQQRSKKMIFGGILALFFVIVFFWPSIRPLIYQGTEPLSKRIFELVGGVYIVPDFIHTYVSSRGTLKREEELLRQQIEILENKVIEQDLHIRELSLLTEGAASSSFVYGAPIIASSLAQDVTKIYATVIFTKGYGDGVEVDDKVFLRGRQIVCVIKEVYAKTSLCSLFSGFGNKVEGVTSSSSINLTLEGRGGHYIANIVRDTNVEVGEKVLFREDQSFIVGEVVEVFNNDQDTSWHVLVRGVYNPAASSLYYIQKKLR